MTTWRAAGGGWHVQGEIDVSGVPGARAHLMNAASRSAPRSGLHDCVAHQCRGVPLVDGGMYRGSLVPGLGKLMSVASRSALGGGTALLHVHVHGAVPGLLAAAFVAAPRTCPERQCLAIELSWHIAGACLRLLFAAYQELLQRRVVVRMLHSWERSHGGPWGDFACGITPNVIHYMPLFPIDYRHVAFPQRPRHLLRDLVPTRACTLGNSSDE